MRLLRDIAKATKRAFRPRTPNKESVKSASRFPRAYRPKTGNLEGHLDKREPKPKPFKRSALDRAFMGIASRPTRNSLAKARAKCS